MSIQYYQKLEDIKVPHVFVFASNLAGLPGHEHSKVARDVYGRTTKEAGMQTTPKGSSYAIATRDQNLVRILPRHELNLALERLKFRIAEDTSGAVWAISHLWVGMDHDPRKTMKELVIRHLRDKTIRDRVIHMAMEVQDARLRTTKNPVR